MKRIVGSPCPCKGKQFYLPCPRVKKIVDPLTIPPNVNSDASRSREGKSPFEGGTYDWPIWVLFQEIFLYSFKINVHVTFLKRYRIRLLIFKLKCQYIHTAQMIIKGIDKLTIKNCFYIYIGIVNGNGARN